MRSSDKTVPGPGGIPDWMVTLLLVGLGSISWRWSSSAWESPRTNLIDWVELVSSSKKDRLPSLASSMSMRSANW